MKPCLLARFVASAGVETGVDLVSPPFARPTRSRASCCATRKRPKSTTALSIRVRSRSASSSVAPLLLRCARATRHWVPPPRISQRSCRAASLLRRRFRDQLIGYRNRRRSATAMGGLAQTAAPFRGPCRRDRISPNSTGTLRPASERPHSVVAVSSIGSGVRRGRPGAASRTVHW